MGLCVLRNMRSSRYQKSHSAVEVSIVDGRSELDEALVELVRQLMLALLNDDLGLAVVAGDVDDVALDVDERHALRRVHVVPDGHVLAALGHNNV